MAVTSPEGAWLVLGRQLVPPTPAMIDALAAELELDPYSSRQKLMVPSPLILRREKSVDAAERASQRLREGGMVAFSVSEQVLASLQPREVRLLSPAKGGFDAELADGSTAAIAVKSILLLVRAQLKSQVVRETDQSDPLLGSVSSYRETTSSKTARVLDIHAVGERGFYRIAEDTFDFARLYPGRTATSAPMMAKVVQWVREAAPNAPFCDDFNAARGLLGTTRTLLDGASLLQEAWFARPFHSRMSVQRSRVTLESDHMAFNLYSALSRLQALLPAVAFPDHRPSSQDPSTHKSAG